MPARPNASNSDVDYSSAPMNHVLATSHTRHRRHENSDGWLNDSKAETHNGSPTILGTPPDGENQRPSSVASSSSSKAEDQGKNDDDRVRQALLQLREHQRSTNSNTIASSSSSNSNHIQVSTSMEDSSVQDKKLSPSNVAGTSRAHSREEGNPVIPDEDMNEEEEDMVDEIEDEDPSAPPSPHDHQDVRIMFHGREIFAEDLIGLRVAKTFAGYGRFVGQVVKFDKKVALYTVVYADGDAEDLTVDGTLQILIQDEIERADPAQVPPAISLLLKKGDDGSSPASPDTGDFMVSPLPGQRQFNTIPRRVQLQVSEREAQFVISLFENHALPTLMRKGWRVQTTNSGDTRYVSPTGELFSSALDVVGQIASDTVLLTSCFPSNVHSAILSLLRHEAPANSTTFTETASTYQNIGCASRKRPSLESPSTDPLVGKRTRQVRGEVYTEVGETMSRGPVRVGNVMQYQADDRDRRSEAARWFSPYRGQGMGGRIRMAGDRFMGDTTNEACLQAPHELRGYQRPPSHDPALINPFASKWSRTEPVIARAESAEYVRRFVNTPGWHERRDTFAVDRHLDVHSSNRSHPDGRSIHQLYRRNSVHADRSAHFPASDTPRSYYRSSSSSSGNPMTNGLSYSHYSTLRSRPNDYTQTSAAPRLSREPASFMSSTDPLRTSAAFSMVDVDRVSTSRSGSLYNGRSPRQSGHQSFLHHQTLQHPRRTNGSHTFHSRRDSENRYDLETASDDHKEQFGSGNINAINTSTQQHE